jgi:hypothetical protein
MNTQNTPTWVRRVLGSALALILVFTSVGNAHALSFLYQDDTYHDVVSEGLNINSDDGGTEAATLKFGNDTTDATIVFDDGGTDNLTFTTVGTGDLVFTSPDALTFTDVNDTLDLSQTSAGLGNDLLNTGGELFSNTGTIGSTIGGGETSTSLVHAINAVGTYAAALGAGANDDIDDVYNNGAAGTYTATVDASSTGYNITSTDGDAFFVQNSGSNIANFSVNATDESIIDLDATEASTFTVATDAAAEDLTLEVTGATDSSVVVSSSGTGADAVDINATAGGVTVDSAAGVSIDAAGASNLTTSSGNLTLSATAGQVVFDDTQLTGTVQLSVADSDWDADFAGDGIVDNVNDITTQIGGDSISTFNFTEANVLTDNDFVYPALEKLDLKWGDLASTANGEGASLVGIEDAGAYTAQTDVEGALQELYGLTPAAGSTDSYTLRWDTVNSAWEENGNLTINDATSAVAVADGTSFTANGAVTLGDGGDAVDVNGTTGNWDLTDLDFDIAGNPSEISLNADGAADDLTVEVTGAHDASLILQSAGTGADAVDINATAGGVTVDAAGALSFQGAADSDITTTGTSDITLTAGDDLIFDDAQLTGIVQMTDTATDWDATFASDGIIDNINSFASTANGAGASNVGIEDAGTYFTGTTVEAALQELGASAGNNVEELTFEAEYPNTTVFPDGSSNKGLLEVDYDSTAREQYYRWTTKKTAPHDIDLRVRYELPADFSATGDLTLDIRTATTTAGDNTVAVTVRNDTDNVTCHADPATTGAVANTWNATPLTITAAEINTGCTGATNGLVAGDVVEVQIQLLADDTNSGYADVGTLVHNYTN